MSLDSTVVVLKYCNNTTEHGLIGFILFNDPRENFSLIWESELLYYTSEYCVHKAVGVDCCQLKATCNLVT